MGDAGQWAFVLGLATHTAALWVAFRRLNDLDQRAHDLKINLLATIRHSAKMQRKLNNIEEP